MKIDHVIKNKLHNGVTKLACSGVNHNLTVFFCICMLCVWFFGVNVVGWGFLVGWLFFSFFLCFLFNRSLTMLGAVR